MIISYCCVYYYTAHTQSMAIIENSINPNYYTIVILHIYKNIQGITQKVIIYANQAVILCLKKKTVFRDLLLRPECV